MIKKLWETGISVITFKPSNNNYGEIREYLNLYLMFR